MSDEMEMKKDIIKSSKHLHLKIESAITAMLAEKDLTAAQSHVLMCIMAGGDVCSADVRKKLNVSRATVSGLMKKLRMKGYITFEGCEEDERQKRIVVTEKAVEHKAEIDCCMKRIEQVTFEDFSDEELRTLHKLINKMSININHITKEAIKL